MKKLITPLVFIAIFAIAGVAAYAAFDHYQSYQAARTAKVRSAEQQANTERDGKLKALQNENVALKNQSIGLQAECQKGVVAYANLSAFQKKNLPAPVCGK